jgi:hypothetical protein
MTALSFQMVNNGVHWISDYPLAIGMGYLFGQVAVDRGRKTSIQEQDDKKLTWQDNLSVVPLYNGNLGLSLSYKFNN